MARYVKISNISTSPCRIERGLDYQIMVEKVKEHLDARIQAVLPDKPDLIVLPEACDRPENLYEEKKNIYYKTRGNQILDHFRETARNNNCYIAYSAVLEDKNGKWHNSTIIIDRKGGIAGAYNKNHLVIEENTVYGTEYGTDAPLIKCDFGTVACAICFDLNFDELRLKYAAARPDIILFSSMYHGGLMQAYWAYSCRVHFVGAIGYPKEEGTIISPIGSIIAYTTHYTRFVTATVNLDCCVAHIDYNWRKFEAMKKKYGTGVKIYDPGLLGSVLLSCETEDKCIYDMVKEFEIELLDDYFKRALAHRRSNLNK
ncbi:MAG: carbon-nitrogen hydrolase family protein [Candidatus Omnitrophica bacterium]|nr:carbon-nitrogen hydrolase family protein [Candidatus Omnitrophota bacterium]